MVRCCQRVSAGATARHTAESRLRALGPPRRLRGALMAPMAAGDEASGVAACAAGRSGHSHSIVSRTHKLLNILSFPNHGVIFTVRYADKKCCLGAIESDRSRKVHTPRGAKHGAPATITYLDLLLIAFFGLSPTSAHRKPWFLHQILLFEPPRLLRRLFVESHAANATDSC